MEEKNLVREAQSEVEWCRNKNETKMNEWMNKKWKDEKIEDGMSLKDERI